MKIHLVLFIFFIVSCNSYNYIQKQKSISTEKRNIAIFIGYNFQENGKIIDLNFFENSKNSLFFDYYDLLIAIDRSKIFTIHGKDSSDSEFELELILTKNQNHSNNYLISLITFHLIPFSTEETIQLEGIFKDRKRRIKSEKKVISSTIKLYHGIFPSIANTITSNEKRVNFYQRMLNDLVYDLEI